MATIIDAFWRWVFKLLDVDDDEEFEDELLLLLFVLPGVAFDDDEFGWVCCDCGDEMTDGVIVFAWDELDSFRFRHDLSGVFVCAMVAVVVKWV